MFYLLFYSFFYLPNKRSAQDKGCPQHPHIISNEYKIHYIYNISPHHWNINYSCFYLGRLVFRRRTIHKTKFSFHPEYRYIFCLPSRRSRQIIRLTPRIVYSFWLLLFSFSYVNACAFSFSFV